MVAGLGNCFIAVETDHGTALIPDIRSVVESVRFMALRGVRLRSDRQPARLLVQNVSVRPGAWAPMVNAIDRPDGAAWIRVTIDDLHWARLAYQFGHELGHVLCNSWGSGCEPRKPCQWVEEVCVEAFSICGLFRMADRWAAKAPHPAWKAYAPELAIYATNTIRAHSDVRLAMDEAPGNSRRGALEDLLLLGDAAMAEVPRLVDAFQRAPRLLDDLGALNRWPSRASVPFDRYVASWVESCSDIGTPGRLPQLFADLFS